MTIAQSGRFDKPPTDSILAPITMAPITALRRQLRMNGFDVLPFSGGRPYAKINTSSHCEWAHHHEIRYWAWEHPHPTSTGIDAKFTPAININIWSEPAAKAVEDLAREFFGEHGNIYVRFGFPPNCDGIEAALAHRRLILLRTD